jgi:Zinc dependent phospholipase C
MLALLLSLSTAAANGQSTHVWISRRALELLPEGELKELLSAQEAALVHGTMFPDGGYPLGDPYAEIAHWEPFQGLYMEWIQDRYAAPWEGQAAHEVAFLFGMASHGMADQSFDACYFNWSSIYDADHGWAAGESFDEASDVIWSSIVGGQELPAQDVPYETLTALYDAYGEPTDIETMQEGQNILELAIGMAGLAGQSPELVESYAAEFPWGGSHLDFHGLPGTPEDAGAVGAAQRVGARPGHHPNLARGWRPHPRPGGRCPAGQAHPLFCARALL